MLPEEALKQIMQGEQVREALSALREMLRSPETAQHTAQLLKSAPGSLHTLLENPDPKVRKNAARLLGELETEESLSDCFLSLLTVQIQMLTKNGICLLCSAVMRINSLLTGKSTGFCWTSFRPERAVP